MTPVAGRDPGSRSPAFLAASGGGVLYFLGYVGFGLWPLLFVFLVPLWRALDETGAAPPARAALLGSVFGLVAYAGGFTWLWRLVPVFLGGDVVLGGLLWLLYGLWFAAGFAVYAVLFRAIRRRGWPVALAGVPPLLALEWIQPQIFTVNAGSGLVYAPAGIQIADLGGPLLLTAVVGAANAVADATWTWWRRRSVAPLPRFAWAAGVALAAAVLGYEALRSAQIETAVRGAPQLRVGIVQANLGVLEKRRQGIVSHRQHLEQTRELLREGEIDLVVWPETAYVRGLRRPLPISGLLVRSDLEVPILFGGTSVDEVDGRRVKSNSAFLVARDGVIHDAYDKNLLIPLAEYAPLSELFPAVARALPHVQEFRAAVETPPLRIGPWRIATPICYEAIRPDFVRRMVADARPHLLVTLANDAWFGDSQEPWMHLALARLRAVEHRRFLVRSTNSGVSAVIDPLGRVVAQSRLFTRESLRGSVKLLEQDTLYGRFGDWPGWVAMLLSAVLLLRTAPRSG